MSGESSTKNDTRGGRRASKKKKISTTQTNTKSRQQQNFCISISTRPKEYPLKPLDGKTPKSRKCRQRYAKKKGKIKKQ